MSNTRPLEKHSTVNGVRLRYLDWGTEGETPLICLHGHTLHARIWDEFAAAASSRYHVLAVDQRGHGESEWASDGYARDRFVEDVAELADTLELSKFVMVGHSMGGWNTLLYAMDHPERVEKIVLVDIGPEPGPAFMAQYDSRLPTPKEFPGLDAVVEWMGLADPWADEARLRRDATDSVRQRDDGKWAWKADPALLDMRLPDLTDPAFSSRYWRAVESITCPILEVRGTESGILADDTVRRMESAAQEFSWVDVAGAGHLVTVDKPDEFIRATRSFLGLPG